MRILLDTNLLTRAAQPDHPQYTTAVSAIEVLALREDILCLVPQNLYEFWVVATRPRAENGLGLSVALTLARLADIKAAFVILEETPAFCPAWEYLVAEHDIKGKTAHDARLVAAMNVHGLSTVLTFNVQHFKRFAGINTLSPNDVISAAS